MSTALWVCLLCMQGYLLTHALDCTDEGTDCANNRVSGFKSRSLLQLDPERDRGNHINLPGAFTAKGFPNTLIQTDRLRRNLNSNKRRHAPIRSRVGSHSLLSHNPAAPLQVVRPRGNVAAAADPAMPPLKSVKQRYKRNATRKKPSTPAVCF